MGVSRRKCLYTDILWHILDEFSTVQAFTCGLLWESPESLVSGLRDSLGSWESSEGGELRDETFGKPGIQWEASGKQAGSPVDSPVGSPVGSTLGSQQVESQPVGSRGKRVGSKREANEKLSGKQVGSKRRVGSQWEGSGKPAGSKREASQWEAREDSRSEWDVSGK